MSLEGMFRGFASMAETAVLEFLRAGAVSAPGLAIKAAGNADASSGAFSYRMGGRVYSKAAIATLSLAALGTVASGAKKTAFLSINAAGTVAITVVSADSYGLTAVPEPAADTCFWGAITVANGSASAFVAGTTALDAAGLTVTYTGLSGVVPGESL